MRSRWLAAVAAPLSLAVFAAGPARAQEDCEPTTGVFSPGVWTSHSVETSGQSDDGLSTLNIYAAGDFALTVDDLGQATGGLTIEGVGGAVMNNGIDKSNMTASYTIEAQLMGTGAHVEATGEMVTDMSGSIDTRGADGKSWLEDEYGVDEDMEFGNTFTLPWSTTITPTHANCNTAFGTFGDTPLSYGDDGTLNTYENEITTTWLAVRHGQSEGADDIEATFIELMEDADFVLNMDPIDTDVLAQFVFDMFAFDSLLASAEYCEKVDLGGLAPGNPAYEMLRSTMLNTVRVFVNAADSGAYTTQDVINVTRLYVQSASLGWRGATGECLQPNVNNEGALDQFVRIEDVLIERYQLASEGNDQQEMAAIVTAAYQFGMPRLIAEVEGR